MVVIAEGGENSKFYLGLLMAANMAPIILFGPLLGTVADRVNRKHCLPPAKFIFDQPVTWIAIRGFAGFDRGERPDGNDHYHSVSTHPADGNGGSGARQTT